MKPYIVAVETGALWVCAVCKRLVCPANLICVRVLLFGLLCLWNLRAKGCGPPSKQPLEMGRNTAFRGLCCIFYFYFFFTRRFAIFISFFFFNKTHSFQIFFAFTRFFGGENGTFHAVVARSSV